MWSYIILSSSTFTCVPKRNENICAYEKLNINIQSIIHNSQKVKKKKQMSIS